MVRATCTDEVGAVQHNEVLVKPAGWADPAPSHELPVENVDGGDLDASIDKEPLVGWENVLLNVDLVDPTP